MVALTDWVGRLAGRRVVVLGDVVLDEYLVGRAARMSREAPVPVLEFEERRLIPGGAANPAANVAALGSEAIQVGVVGADDRAAQLAASLTARGIHNQHLIADPTRPTTHKLRVMASMGLRFPQQVARLDTLSREAIPAPIAAQVTDIIRDALPKADALLFSDYRGGMLTPSLVADLRREAGDRVLLTADAQGDFGKYVGFDVVKCNAGEAADALDERLSTDADYARAAVALTERLRLRVGMVITRGPQGATVALRGGAAQHIPAPHVSDVFDTVGAGDTAITVTTLALIAGASLAEAVRLANYASSLVVRKVGNATPTPDELRWALDNWHD